MGISTDTLETEFDILLRLNFSVSFPICPLECQHPNSRVLTVFSFGRTLHSSPSNIHRNQVLQVDPKPCIKRGPFLVSCRDADLYSQGTVHPSTVQPPGHSTVYTPGAEVWESDTLVPILAFPPVCWVAWSKWLTFAEAASPCL